MKKLLKWIKTSVRLFQILALARHMTFKDLSESEFLIRAEKQIECLNNAIKNIDSSSIRLHICWGNYEGSSFST